MTLRILIVLTFAALAGCTTRSEKAINSDKDSPRASSAKTN